jgi:hypothetical protein
MLKEQNKRRNDFKILIKAPFYIGVKTFDEFSKWLFADRLVTLSLQTYFRAN